MLCQVLSGLTHKSILRHCSRLDIVKPRKAKQKKAIGKAAVAARGGALRLAYLLCSSVCQLINEHP